MAAAISGLAATFYVFCDNLPEIGQFLAEIPTHRPRQATFCCKIVN